MADYTQTEWRENLEKDNNAIIVDVRTNHEIEEGYIPNAMHIDIYQGQEFINKVQELDKNKNYYIYCKSGGRSAQACAIMNQLGFKNAYNLLGGFTEWTGDTTTN
jgi:rhodanese-related sulfurtransferase